MRSVHLLAALCSYHIDTPDRLKLNFWDVGGQRSLRSYWKNYFESTDGVVWVVDSSDQRRLQDCKAELHSLLKEEVSAQHKCCSGHVLVFAFQRLASASLLVFANKQDLPGALSADEVRHVRASACCTHTQEGCSALSPAGSGAGQHQNTPLADPRLQCRHRTQTHGRCQVDHCRHLFQSVHNGLTIIKQQSYLLYVHSLRHFAEQRKTSTGTDVSPFLSTVVTVAAILCKSSFARWCRNTEKQAPPHKHFLAESR